MSKFGEILVSILRATARYFTITALILQIIGTWACQFLIKNPYDLMTSFTRHAVPEGGDGRCVTFGTYKGISLDGSVTDSTYNFAKWMSYLATIFGVASVFSDCTILRTCPCSAAGTRFVQMQVVGWLQLTVGIMLSLSFTVLNSQFCLGEWTVTSDEAPSEGPYSCSLAWGGICVVVATALWVVAAGMTLGKAYKDNKEELRKEETQADAEARETIKVGDGVDGGADSSGGAAGDAAAAAAASKEEAEGI